MRSTSCAQVEPPVHAQEGLVDQTEDLVQHQDQQAGGGGANVTANRVETTGSNSWNVPLHSWNFKNLHPATKSAHEDARANTAERNMAPPSRLHRRRDPRVAAAASAHVLHGEGGRRVRFHETTFRLTRLRLSKSLKTLLIDYPSGVRGRVLPGHSHSGARLPVTEVTPERARCRRGRCAPTMRAMPVAASTTRPAAIRGASSRVERSRHVRASGDRAPRHVKGLPFASPRRTSASALLPSRAAAALLRVPARSRARPPPPPPPPPRKLTWLDRLSSPVVILATRWRCPCPTPGTWTAAAR